MKIKVQITRSENAKFWNCNINDVISMDFENEYLMGAVPSEIGNAPLEACKAQACAARTFAYNYILSESPISDSSSVAQAYRAPRATSNSYSIAHQAVKETDGIIITYNGKPIRAHYSSSNGGRIRSAEERWGNYVPYEIAKDDPWDVAGEGDGSGHHVGMSQCGAKYAASIGKTYQEILLFYYTGVELMGEYGKTPVETYVNATKLEDTIVGKTISAKALINEFYKMLGWRYEWGAARTGVVDCSGAFTYAFSKLSSWMYHGSNTMYKKYSYDKGRLGTIELLPGMAVYKWKSPDDFHHVGLYIGAGLVIEAKGSKYGVVVSRVEDWHYAGKLKSKDGTVVLYDVKEFSPESYSGKVTSNGSLKMRSATETVSSNVLKSIPSGENVSVLKIEVDFGWYAIKYNGTLGFVMQDYITPSEVIEDQVDHDLFLTIGSSGNQVVQLQTWLVSLSYELPKYGIDGKYGEETKEAVVKFQKDNGLTDNGVCDLTTWNTMVNIINPPVPKKDIRVVTSKNVPLNVRTGAGVNYEDIGDLSYGSTVAVLEDVGSWSKIEWENGVGWCSNKYLKKV